jgi:hypothetical protein
MERAFTDFLTPDSTFLTGAGSVLNLDGSNFFYNRSGNRVLADARAIHQDFIMVGEDILEIVRRLDAEQTRQLALGL